MFCNRSVSSWSSCSDAESLEGEKSSSQDQSSLPGHRNQPRVSHLPPVGKTNSSTAVFFSSINILKRRNRQACVPLCPPMCGVSSCAAAYVLLAEEEATTITEAERLFKKALTIGKCPSCVSQSFCSRLWRWLCVKLQDWRKSPTAAFAWWNWKVMSSFPGRRQELRWLFLSHYIFDMVFSEPTMSFVCFSASIHASPVILNLACEKSHRSRTKHVPQTQFCKSHFVS